MTVGTIVAIALVATVGWGVTALDFGKPALGLGDGTSVGAAVAVGGVRVPAAGGSKFVVQVSATQAQALASKKCRSLYAFANTLSRSNLATDSAGVAPLYAELGGCDKLREGFLQRPTIRGRGGVWGSVVGCVVRLDVADTQS